MTNFSESLREGSSRLLQRVRSHRVLKLIAEDSLPDDRLRILLGQSHLFGQEYERYLSSLIARAPREIRRSFVEAMMDLNWDSDLLEEVIRRSGIDPSSQKMSFPCRCFVDFLFSQATVQSFPEAICAGYGAADSTRTFWSEVMRSPAGFERSDVAAIWCGEGVRNWIHTVRNAIDGIAARTPASLHERMLESYSVAFHYHVRLLDLSLEESAYT